MAVNIGRRQFISANGGAAATWPLAVRAQQTAKRPTIGYLNAMTPGVDSARTAAFVGRLRELGWIEGSNVTIDYRYAEGRSERLSELAAELVQLKVDIIVTSATAPIVAAKQATSVIPIVFAEAADPLGNGLVASLAHPGGNVTGMSILTTDLVGKRMELMRELIPGLKRLAILADADSPSNVLEVEEAQTAARKLGLEVAAFRLRRVEDITPTFDALKGRTDALYACASPFVFGNRISINSLALEARLPIMHGNREFLEQGGLVSYGPNILNQYRRAAEYVDKILRGAKPADLPVEQPTEFELIINLNTAKALGLSIPQTLLATAADLIE
jgi:putative tryptophan/tyrosine transport system substrate-binding protein